MASSIDGSTYDLYNFKDDGRYKSSKRNIRVTKVTMSENSRTVISEHKKQWVFDLQYLSDVQMTAIDTALQKATFVFIPTPYDSTSYTVKCTNEGKINNLSNTSEYFGRTGIILEEDS